MTEQASNGLSQEIAAKVEQWLRDDQNPETRSEIQKLVAEKNEAELKRRLIGRLEFGTAGLRARMGAGYTMMNDLTIIGTCQGLLAYMLNINPDITTNGVIIGYDARHNSKRWAEISANILIRAGIKVYLYSTITPTPFVPYGVRQLGCDWGIMVTASHNPKQDNGYKVYYGNGAQIIPPHDSNIAKCIDQHTTPLPTSWDLTALYDSPLLTDPLGDMSTRYMNDLTNLSHYRDTNSDTKLRFTYTAMHGVGYKSILEAFKQFNLPPLIPVKEQVEPDPEFPTVEFPNPEEGKSSLKLSMQTADEHNSTIILANDPDADRLAVAEKQPESGPWYVFTGNELGALIGWWLWTCYSSKGNSGKDVYILSSTVSSRIMQSIAKKDGFNFCETLTGFKWMGNKTVELMNEGKSVLFAFEEAIGFMCGTQVLDKDGVSAAVIAAELCVYLERKELTLRQQLDVIYQTYGFHVSSNSYFLCYDQTVIKNLFDRLRNFSGLPQYPTSLGPYEIKYVRDLTTGYDNCQPDNKAVLPVSSSQMITFTFTNGCVITMRTSGTEPKIKYYSELVAQPGLPREECERELDAMVALLKSEFFEPEKNKLISKSP